MGVQVFNFPCFIFSFLFFLNNQMGRKWLGLVGTGGPLENPQIHAEASVMVAEVGMRSRFTEISQLTLQHVFQTAGGEVRVGPPLLQMRGRRSPPPLKLF